MGLGFFFILLFAGLIITLLLRVRFEVEYQRKGQDDHLKVEMSLLWSLIRYRTEVPVVDLDSYFLKPLLKMEADIEAVASDPIEDKGLVVKIPILTLLRKLPVNLKHGLYLLDKYNSALKKLLKTVRCHNLRWTTVIGLDDPANTGIITGLLWGTKGFLYSIFRSHVGLMQKAPSFSVVPSFNGPRLALDFNCIFDIRIGHIIIAGLKIVKLRFRT